MFSVLTFKTLGAGDPYDVDDFFLSFFFGGGGEFKSHGGM